MKWYAVNVTFYLFGIVTVYPIYQIAEIIPSNLFTNKSFYSSHRE